MITGENREGISECGSPSGLVTWNTCIGGVSGMQLKERLSLSEIYSDEKQKRLGHVF